MIFDRQKRLLALLDTHGGEVNRLDFQKLLFLYCMNVERIPSYQFVPYKFGGFSFTSYADKRRLTENGLLDDTERTWKLTKAGKAAAKVNSATRTEMHLFAKQYANVRGDALVAAAYRQHLSTRSAATSLSVSLSAIILRAGGGRSSSASSGNSRGFHNRIRGTLA